jgi:IS30 family transposase
VGAGETPQVCKLATRPVLRDIVAEKLAARWSPQQIAGWLKATYPNDAELQVSHETIYRTLFILSLFRPRGARPAHAMSEPHGTRTGVSVCSRNRSDGPGTSTETCQPRSWGQ